MQNTKNKCKNTHKSKRNHSKEIVQVLTTKIMYLLVLKNFLRVRLSDETMITRIPAIINKDKSEPVEIRPATNSIIAPLIYNVQNGKCWNI